MDFKRYNETKIQNLNLERKEKGETELPFTLNTEAKENTRSAIENPLMGKNGERDERVAAAAFLKITAPGKEDSAGEKICRQELDSLEADLAAQGRATFQWIVDLHRFIPLVLAFREQFKKRDRELLQKISVDNRSKTLMGNEFIWSALEDALLEEKGLYTRKDCAAFVRAFGILDIIRGLKQDLEKATLPAQAHLRNLLLGMAAVRLLSYEDWEQIQSIRTDSWSGKTFWQRVGELTDPQSLFWAAVLAANEVDIASAVPIKFLPKHTPAKIPPPPIVRKF